MTIEQRVAVLEEIFSKLQDYYMSDYSGEEIDALLASAGVPIGITKEYDSVSAMNDDFSSTDVTRGQFVLILTTDTSSEDYGKVYLKGSANWVYVFTLTSLTAIKGPQGPAGKRGAKGADGADGKNFMVLGYYETLSALNAAVPSPGTGDTYGVGTEPPYAFYMYDPTISNWRYVGNLQGPEGPVGGSSNFVRYDAAQSLTDAQKQQARGNIGAAPDGFGLGGSATLLTSADNLDALMKSGWFYYNTSNAPQGTLPTALASYATLVHVSAAGNTCVQEAYDPTDSGLHGTVLRRTIYGVGTGAKIYPWEWVNPFMQLGVEYRTTERYLGKPVYVRLVNCGSAPSNSLKKIDTGLDYTVIDRRLTPTGNMYARSDDNYSIPCESTDVAGDNLNIVHGTYRDSGDVKHDAIFIYTTSTTLTGYTVYVVLKYTKTTD